MPLLDDDQLKNMHERPERKCEKCKRTLFPNYCRQCDMFFDEGHNADCPNLDKPGTPYGNNHEGHRTY